MYYPQEYLRFALTPFKFPLRLLCGLRRFVIELQQDKQEEENRLRREQQLADLTEKLAQHGRLTAVAQQQLGSDRQIAVATLSQQNGQYELSLETVLIKLDTVPVMVKVNDRDVQVADATELVHEERCDTVRQLWDNLGEARDYLVASTRFRPEDLRG